VATRPAGVNGLGWQIARANSEVGQILAQFPVLDDRPEVFVHWLAIVAAYGVTGRKVHDARLVAVMLAYSLTHLLTSNTQDFKSYSAITSVDPSSIP
jgi:predicted nucleic acid-binding protein